MVYCHRVVLTEEGLNEEGLALRSEAPVVCLGVDGSQA